MNIDSLRRPLAMMACAAVLLSSSARAQFVNAPRYVAVATGSSGGSIPLTGSATIILFGQ